MPQPQIYRPLRPALYFVLPAFALLASSLTDGLAVHLFTRAALLGAAALALTLLFGWAGQLSLGQAGFLAVGGYTHIVLLAQGVPSLVSLPVAAGASALCGLLIARATRRLAGAYLVVVTLGFQVGVEQTVARMQSITGGRMGKPVPASVFDTPWVLLVTAAVVLACVAYAWTGLEHRKTGRAWKMLRDQPFFAPALGIDVRSARRLAFLLSASVTGLAGALLVHLGDAVHPSQFSLGESIELLIIVLLARGRVLGTVFFAGLVTLLGDQLSWFRDHQSLVFGLILLATVLSTRSLVRPAAAATPESAR